MRTESYDVVNNGLIDKIIWSMRTARVARHLPKHATHVADLGCGRHATLLQKLLARGYATRAIGVDLAPLENSPHEALELIRGDLNTLLPIPDAHVDVVLSLAVYEHLTHPQVHAEEIFRILKPGGTMILTTPSPRGKPVLEFLAYRLKILDRREIDDHKKYYTSAELYTAFREVGFAASHIHVQMFQLGMNTLVIATK